MCLSRDSSGCLDLWGSQESPEWLVCLGQLASYDAMHSCGVILIDVNSVAKRTLVSSPLTDMDPSFAKSLARGEPHAKRQARERAKWKRDAENRLRLIQEIQRRREAFLKEVADPRYPNVQDPIFASLPQNRTETWNFQMFADQVKDEQDRNDVANLPW